MSTIIPRFRPAVRDSRIARAALWSFVAIQAVLGGLSGILIAALILNRLSPGHPFFLGIQGWLRGILGM